MRKRLLASALAFVAFPALAQQAAQDPEVVVYKQMLAEREEQLALTTKQATEQISSLQRQVFDLQTKLKAAAPKDPAPKDPAPKEPAPKDPATSKDASEAPAKE